MAILTNTEVVNALGGTVSAADQTVITLIKGWSERLVKDYVGYNIEQATFTHDFPIVTQAEPREELIQGWEIVGNRAVAYGPYVEASRVLQLRELPVRSITSVNEDTAEPPTFGSSTLLTSTDYRLDTESSSLSWSGFLYRVGSSWSKKPRTIRVVYVGGLTATELENDYPEFKMATLLTVIKSFNELKSQQGYAAGTGSAGPVQAESLADWSITYGGNSSTNLFGMTYKLPMEAARILEGKVRMSKFRQ